MNRDEFISRFGFDPSQKKLSYSRMKHILVSIKEYVNNILNPKDPTPDMILGQLFECLLLQPETFSKEFFIAPEPPNFPNVTEQKKMKVQEPVSVKDQQSAYDKIIADSAKGKKIITREMYAKAIRMVNACNLHPLAKQLISQENIFQKHFELDINDIIVHGYLDILCKAKEDIILNGKVVIPKGFVYIIDIKKTNDVTLDALERTSKKFKYYIQAFLYHFAILQFIKAGKIKLVDGQSEVPCLYLFQQDNAPYDTHIVDFEDVYFNLAKIEIGEAIQTFKAFIEEPEKIFYGINAGISTLKAKKYQFDEVNDRQKHEKFMNNSEDFQKFMIEKELDIEIAKPSISVSLQNVFNLIEVLKKEKEKSVDNADEKKENSTSESELHTSTDETTTAGNDPNIQPPAVVAPEQINKDSEANEEPKRKRRTKAEIEAARIMELQNVSHEEAQTDIFSASQTAELSKPLFSGNVYTGRQDKNGITVKEGIIENNVSTISKEEIQEEVIKINDNKIAPEKMDDLTFLFDYGKAIEGYASGIHAVKNVGIKCGFWKDHTQVKLDALTLDQKYKIYDAITEMLNKQKEKRKEKSNADLQF